MTPDRSGNLASDAEVSAAGDRSRVQRLANTIGIGRSTARTSMATRLAASVVFIALLSLVAATVVGVTTGERLAEDLNDQHLRATAETAAADVAAELRSTQRTTEGLAASPQVNLAITGFTDGLDTLGSDATDLRTRETEELIEVYSENYLEPLREAGRNVELRDILSESTAARRLQYAYAIDLGPLARPATLDDAGDGSLWSDIHAIFHGVYREIVATQDLVDLYLVSADGSVLYTVNKRPDLGTSLRTGPFSGSVVADTFRRAAELNEPGVVTSDVQFYDAVPGNPIGVVGSPIFEGSRLQGVLMVAYDSSAMTDLVTADRSWEVAGFPETADVFVVGADGRARTDLRGFLEDRSGFLDSVDEVDGLDDDARIRIEATGTAVLSVSIVDETQDAGLRGDESVRLTTDVVGKSVWSLAIPVRSDALQWFVVAEVDETAAGRGLGEFEEILIIGAVIYVVLLAFVAMAWANSIVRPIRLISDRISRHGGSDRPIEVPPQTPVEIQQLAWRLDSMRDTMVAQREQIAQVRRERLDVMRSLLPSSIADRVVSRADRVVDQAPDATVAVAVIVGLDDLVRAGSIDADRRLVDRLLVDLDQIADAHGLERIKVVGDAYHAVCGHQRPYIDHAPRAVAFATEASEVVTGSGFEPPLTLAVGVHSGSVSTGISGGASHVYDVWGDTVSHAHRLARRSVGGEILISAGSCEMLPDTFEVEPVETSAARGDTFRVLQHVLGSQA